MTKLAYLHEPGMLYNLAAGFALNEIYVSCKTENHQIPPVKILHWIHRQNYNDEKWQVLIMIWVKPASFCHCRWLQVLCCTALHFNLHDNIYLKKPKRILWIWCIWSLFCHIIRCSEFKRDTSYMLLGLIKLILAGYFSAGFVLS